MSNKVISLYSQLQTCYQYRSLHLVLASLTADFTQNRVLVSANQQSFKALLVDIRILQGIPARKLAANNLTRNVWIWLLSPSPWLTFEWNANACHFTIGRHCPFFLYQNDNVNGQREDADPGIHQRSHELL